MKPLVICLMFALSIVTAHASYLLRTVSGQTYKTCTILKVAVNAVVVHSEKGDVTLQLDRLLPSDRARIEPELRRLRAEADKQAAISAKVVAARKASAQATQAIELNPPVDVTTGDGHLYHSVAKLVINGSGDEVTISSDEGIGRIRFEALSKDWQKKLQPDQERAKQDGADYQWEKRISDARAEMEANKAKAVTAKLCGPHKAGIRAYLTSERTGVKVLSMATEVVIVGLPESFKFGNWSGTLVSKGVYADRKTNEVFQVWATLK
ncbi:MAG: hypothetical protein JWO89_1656 [Verrucomicrobiaceae bacterium]|nr:hypothetical protein [Verrucomicrobiaceae bacterium]